VYHVDALNMASVIGQQGGQMPFGKFFFSYVFVIYHVPGF
jgi:hypothetical protein